MQRQVAPDAGSATADTVVAEVKLLDSVMRALWWPIDEKELRRQTVHSNFGWNLIEAVARSESIKRAARRLHRGYAPTNPSP